MRVFPSTVRECERGAHERGAACTAKVSDPSQLRRTFGARALGGGPQQRPFSIAPPSRTPSRATLCGCSSWERGPSGSEATRPGPGPHLDGALPAQERLGTAWQFVGLIFPRRNATRKSLDRDQETLAPIFWRGRGGGSSRRRRRRGAHSPASPVGRELPCFSAMPCPQARGAQMPVEAEGKREKVEEEGEEKRGLRPPARPPASAPSLAVAPATQLGHASERAGRHGREGGRERRERAT